MARYASPDSTRAAGAGRALRKVLRPVLRVAERLKSRLLAPRMDFLATDGTPASRWRLLARQVALPVTIMVVVAAFDLSVPDTVFYPFLLLAPTLACATAPPLAVLAIGCASLPLRYLLAHHDGYLASEFDQLFQVSTWMYVLATALSMYLSAVRIRRERELVAVTKVATAAQRAILMPPPAEYGGLRFAVRYFAVADEAELGGDLYLALDTPYGPRILIGDVLGKGLGAVRTAAITIGAFREAAYDEVDLVDIARRIEASLQRNAPAERFVTALLVEVRSDHVIFVHRGHEQPVLVTADGRARVLDPPEPGVPLGLGDLDTVAPRSWGEPFREGDLLLLVTDGVSDARNESGMSYPVADRINALVGGRAPAEPAVAVERLGEDLLRFAGRRRMTDDALMVGLARKPSESG
ncbi:PP2C family protein-serine/threonine phosphatase [Uniformispora flossi]|uniref:PP2C family protein-serine/threonine phosphatase n=1 Tax=Uniformispora flossi TaxID=3390723 RepID=UPI003C2DB6E8